MSASAIAKARLQRRAPRPDAKAVFEQAYAACRDHDCAGAAEICVQVHEQDDDLFFEDKALPGMLMLSPEDDGQTLLHVASADGDTRGAVLLLRLGSNASQRNVGGRSSIDLAKAQGHADTAALLRAHNDVWSGWGLVELSCLACLYHLDDQFADGEAYLRRMIERDRAKRAAAANGSGSLFHRRLPCGLSMLGIATQVSTAGFQILREEFDVALGGGCVEEEEEAEAPGAAVEAATPEAETETGDLTNPEEAAEWPDDGWVPPCTEYMYCSLCKGRSGVAGRWGVPGEGLEPSALRCPLMVCQPCQRWHGLLQAEDGQGEQADASWVQDTLLVEAREGIWGQRVAQLVHPILGEIGH